MTRASDNPALFWIRCFVDLQLLTIYKFLKDPLLLVEGRLLDVGAGEGPWRDLLSRSVEYVAVDIDSSSEFGIERQHGMHYYDGNTLPFESNSFDVILCTEVVEHVREPQEFLKELNRVLRQDGKLILTVPWSARVHHIPNDYSRFSRFGLNKNLIAAHFCEIEIFERGNDVAAIANKLVVLMVRLLWPANKYLVFLTWPSAMLIFPIPILFLFLAHGSFAFNLGSKDDPLGYGVLAKKRCIDT